MAIGALSSSAGRLLYKFTGFSNPGKHGNLSRFNIFTKVKELSEQLSHSQ
jgi:hypothetical protein